MYLPINYQFRFCKSAAKINFYFERTKKIGEKVLEKNMMEDFTLPFPSAGDCWSWARGNLDIALLQVPQYPGRLKACFYFVPYSVFSYSVLF